MRMRTSTIARAESELLHSSFPAQNIHGYILTNQLKSICLPRSFILLELNIFCLSCVYNITYVYSIILHKSQVWCEEFVALPLVS